MTSKARLKNVVVFKSVDAAVTKAWKVDVALICFSSKDHNSLYCKGLASY